MSHVICQFVNRIFHQLQSEQRLAKETGVQEADSSQDLADNPPDMETSMEVTSTEENNSLIKSSDDTPVVASGDGEGALDQSKSGDKSYDKSGDKSGDPLDQPLYLTGE